MNKQLILTLAALLLIPAAAFAGFTDTLPKNTFMLDVSYVQSSLDKVWDHHGEERALLDEIERYEPGGGLQGVLSADAEASFSVLVAQLAYGITDSLTLGVGVPIVLETRVETNLSWEEGNYQTQLGRSYSEEDFWGWAESMGQPKPPDSWEGNHGVMGDVQIALIYRWSDRVSWFREHALASNFLIFGTLPTGTHADPEELVSAGTSSWELHSNGDLGVHFGVDKFFPESLDGRLILGAELFYEALLPHTFEAPQGEKNPLLLNARPYTGRWYTVDGGDFSGFSVQTDVVPYKGPALGTWLVKGDKEAAAKLPPLVTVGVRYTFNHLQQTDYESDSSLWDWEKEKEWRPGYKNILQFQLQVALPRVGLPMIPYVRYRNLSWIPGKNTRAADTLTAGTRILMKFW